MTAEHVVHEFVSDEVFSLAEVDHQALHKDEETQDGPGTNGYPVGH